MSLRWTRRAVLARLGGGAALWPLVPLLEGDAEAQTAPKKRLIVYFYPNGTNVPANYIAQAGDGSLTLSRILTPLADHKQDLTVLEGITNMASEDGFKHGHISYMGSMLTGMPILTQGAFVELGKQYGWAAGPSIDQIVARQIGRDTAFPSLEFHVLGNSEELKTQYRMCYRDSNQPITGMQNPTQAFTRVFAVGGAQLAQLQGERRSIIDYLKGDLARLQTRIGAEDKARLDGHLTGLREVESRLKAPVQPLTCSATSPGTFTRVQGSGTIYQNVGKAHMDLMVSALACDATRVASLQWGAAGRGATMSWLGHSKDEHGLSHAGPDAPADVEQFIQTRVYHMSVLASLITKLKTTLDANKKPLMDSTIILACSEHGTGYLHDNKNMPFLLVGSAGGAFKTGRYLKYSPAVSHNRMLVSVARAMGLVVDKIGTDKYGAGGLPGL